MFYLELDEVVRLHAAIISASGGLSGIREIGGLESAIAQPQMEMFGAELYPTIFEKAGILGFSIILNHPFLDGNKRIGHAAMETFLFMNGFEIEASVDEQESIILRVAAGEMPKEAFTEWLKSKIKSVESL
ncbi:MAG: type II toxin-antitoxin system death-on-curing family toxin [Lewinellaceae bacterium]|nr:type II toxin-antitoxin system death-on-curing family toxin [Lewinellaceae bacterium]